MTNYSGTCSIKIVVTILSIFDVNVLTNYAVIIIQKITKISSRY